MPKALCIFAMVVAIIVLVLFSSDLLLGLFGIEFAPFRGFQSPETNNSAMIRWIMDVVFAVSGGVLGFLSWKTFKEQV